MKFDYVCLAWFSYSLLQVNVFLGSQDVYRPKVMQSTPVCAQKILQRMQSERKAHFNCISSKDAYLQLFFGSSAPSCSGRTLRLSPLTHEQCGASLCLRLPWQLVIMWSIIMAHFISHSNCSFSWIIITTTRSLTTAVAPNDVISTCDERSRVCLMLCVARYCPWG